MNDTQTNSLFTELTAQESATINGAHYYNPWWRNRYYRPWRPYRSYNNSSTVKVRVNVNIDD